MLVNYDFSSDEEEGKDSKTVTTATKSTNPITSDKKKDTNQVAPQPTKKVVTLKLGGGGVTNKGKSNKLPDVDNLLSAIPADSLLENASRRSQKSTMQLNDESYNNVAPPDFSLAEEGEYNDKVRSKYRNRENKTQSKNTLLVGNKRKAPSGNRADDDDDDDVNECPVVDKWFKTDDRDAERGEPMRVEEEEEEDSAKGRGGNPFLPPQVSQKRPNISVIE
jgi:hypothetical protein